MLLASKNINPESLQINGPYSVECGEYVEYSMPEISGATYTWSSDNGYLIKMGGNYATTYFYAIGYIPGGGNSIGDILRCTVTLGGTTIYQYTPVYITNY